VNISSIGSGGDGNHELFSKLNAANNLSSMNKSLEGKGEVGADFASILNAARTMDSPAGLDGQSQPHGELRESFNDFVGQTFFGQLLSSMRSTQEEAPYFNGGRAEKIFQGQLDQVLTEELSESSASKIADPMFKLFQAYRA
jgi:Rod binding domain-containing protein